MNTSQRGLSATPIALTVELDLAAVNTGLRPPPPLPRQPAGQLADAVAADLTRILGSDIQACGLLVPAALYDMTELIQPSLPWVEVLLEIYRGSLPDTRFTPQIMGIGGSDPFPIAAMAPQRRPGSGPLLILPILVVGEPATIERIQPQLEEILLDRGRASMATEQIIRRDFQTAPLNLSYATLDDLSALLKIQLGHAGLEPLWQLLEGALFRPERMEHVKLAEHNEFIGLNGEICTVFHTYDQWAAVHGNDTLGYRHWLLRQRLYEAGLAAHGLSIRRLRSLAQVDASCSGKLAAILAEHEITADVLREPEQDLPALEEAELILLTEHSTPELGPIGYTVLVQASDDRVLHVGNEYPLTAEAAAALREYWAETATRLGLSLHLAQPGEILTSDDGMHLMPQVEFGEGAH